MRNKTPWPLIIISILFCVGLWWVRDALSAFIIGMILAYVLAPFVHRLTQAGFSRTAACLLPVALFYALFLCVVAFLVPLVWMEGQDLLQSLQTYSESQHMWLQDQLAVWGVPLEFDTAQLAQASQFLAAGLLSSLGGITQGLGAVGSFFSLLLITPLVAFYIVREWESFSHFLQDMLPPKKRKTLLDLWQRIDKRLSGFIRGQFLVVVCLGLIYGGGLMLVGIPFGFVLGSITGLLSFIPVVGGMVGMALTFATVLLHVQFNAWEPYALTLAVFTVGSLLENFVLTPKLVGDNVGLHPLWVILALMIGGQLAGITGMLLAVPVAAVVAELAPFYVTLWQKSPWYKS